ncbi:HD domain-containing protein [Luteolibacter ambystomatis]|uniref:HD domain-containing protein n=2 Tax=Luteolibacter ambystomatis TaxID=2824561 RepID=A0A975J3D9_9BACT|nr:HD domain-containing protein [Luteolibacter ambystomatis]
MKGSKLPYFVHCSGVAATVSSTFQCQDAEVVAAAFLHDVLEKTRMTAKKLESLMGRRVMALVQMLTKPSRGNPKDYWERLREAGWEARLIKMADALDHLAEPSNKLPARIVTGHKTLALAFGKEREIQLAREVLSAALDNAVMSVVQESGDDRVHQTGANLTR